MLKPQDVARTDDHSASVPGSDENRLLKKTDSLKENDGTVERSWPPARRATTIPSTLASRPAPINSQNSGIVAKPLTNRPEVGYPLYDYADNIPKPNVIYITDEEQANEMITSLNG